MNEAVASIVRIRAVGRIIADLLARIASLVPKTHAPAPTAPSAEWQAFLDLVHSDRGVRLTRLG